jgi:hypothetical protein
MLEMITEHKYTGADSRHDLLSSMIDASNEEAGDALTDSELMGKALLCRVNSRVNFYGQEIFISFFWRVMRCGHIDLTRTDRFYFPSG